MENGLSRDITALLAAWSHGEREALEKLVPAVHQELRQIAKRHLQRDTRDAVLDTTALLNEAYLRILDIKGVVWQDRAHFFAVAAKILRHIMVDYARTRRRTKRGSGVRPLSLSESILVASERSSDLVAVDDALNALASIDPRKAEVVELRFFGGLSVEETADVLKVSAATVMRDWRLAKVWLMRELSGGPVDATGSMATDRRHL